MKKLCLVIFLFFALQLKAFAKTGVSLIYINGSNIKDEKIKKWYLKGVRKFHPCMKNAFEQSPFTQKYFLQYGKYYIKELPIIFVWGDKDYQNSANAKRNSATSKGLIIWLACKIRSTAKNVLHDIIWVQNHHNMNVVLDKLHKLVMAEIQKGNKILFYGYSSGSFITYEYFLSRTPYINVAEFFDSVDASKEQRDFVFQHPMKNTCVSALEQKLAVYSADGHAILGNDFNIFKTNYMNLDKETDSVCVPDNAVIGIVNIASPLVLFKSDISDPNFSLTYYNRLLYKYIFENDIFWLTVNYSEDPLSFPSGKNLKIKELENIMNLDIEPRAGFIYGQSNARGGIFAITHLYYLSQPKTLSKAIVKAYEDGYRYQYGDMFKQKTSNNNHKKTNISP